MRQLNKMVNSAARMLGMVVVFGALSAQAQADAQNSITAMNVSNAGNGTTVIKVDMAQPLANPPAGFTINTPPRIAFDFPNTANGLGKSVQDFSEGDLRSANIVQAGARTRLVVNLNQMLSYDTKIEGNSLLITLHGKVASAASSDNISRFAEAKQGVQKHTLRDIDFRRGKNGEGRIQVDLSDAGIGIDIRQQGTTLVVDFLKTNLPRNLQRKLDVVDFATPVQGVDTYVQGDNVRMVIEPKGMWEHAAYQTDNKFIIEVKPVAEDPNKLVKGNQLGYAGEKLTLNFQKIDVREALNVIADFTNLNMVISDSVSGNLTLRLKDVPWDQALDIILQSRGLDMRKNGNVIQVAPREELAAKEKLDLSARQDISELEELRTESFQLSYQQGADIQAILSGGSAQGAGKGQSILSKRGSVVIDKHTNTLFVQDTPSRLEEVRRMIKQIDVPVRQVVIEARIVDANEGVIKDIGVNLSYKGAPSGFAVGSNTPTATRGQVGSNVNLPGGGTAGQFTFSLFNAAATKLLNLTINALETDNNGKIISNPRVVTGDNIEATIEQGQEIPYTVSTTTGSPTTSFKKATLSLKVTPKITPDDNVNLKVTVTDDTIGAVPAGSTVPALNTKRVDTTVQVENGGTVVLGGIFKQTNQTDVGKVPLLGDIPVMGNLFKQRKVTDTRTEMLIFITPKIMKDTLNLR